VKESRDWLCYDNAVKESPPLRATTWATVAWRHRCDDCRWCFSGATACDVSYSSPPLVTEMFKAVEGPCLRCHPTVSPLGDGMDAAKKFDMKKLKSATKEGLDLEDDGEEKKKA